MALSSRVIASIAALTVCVVAALVVLALQRVRAAQPDAAPVRDTVVLDALTRDESLVQLRRDRYKFVRLMIEGSPDLVITRSRTPLLKRTALYRVLGSLPGGMHVQSLRGSMRCC